MSKGWYRYFGNCTMTWTLPYRTSSINENCNKCKTCGPSEACYTRKTGA